MAWQELTPVRRIAPGPEVSISSSGHISWTQTMDQAMDRPAFVKLLFDKRGMRLGIQPGNSGDGLSVRRGHGCRICAMNTLREGGVWDHIEEQLPIRGRPARKDGALFAISIRPDRELLAERYEDEDESDG